MAAVFQGDGAEEQWHAEISRYSNIRFMVSPVPRGYMPRFSTMFRDCFPRLKALANKDVLDLDLIPHREILEKRVWMLTNIYPLFQEDTWLHYFPISTNVSVKLGSIRHFTGAEYENSFEFAFTSKCVVDDRRWSTEDHIIDRMWNQLNGDEEGTLILENDFHYNHNHSMNSANVVDGYRRRVYADVLSCTAWLVQANHIFNALGVTSNFHEYALVGSIQYHLRLLGPLDNLPPGYLFLCPLTEIQTELPGHVLIPACTAYWSRDPSGAERLSTEEAKNEGFPDIDCCMWAIGGSWDPASTPAFASFTKLKALILTAKRSPQSLGVHFISIPVDSLHGFKVQERNKEDDYSDSNGGNDFAHSDDQESETEALQATALAEDTETNTYEHEDFFSDLHQTDERNGPSFKAGANSGFWLLASRSAEFGWNHCHLFCVLQSRHPGQPLQPSTAPLGELDDLVDPLRDLDAAEVDAIMILCQLGARLSFGADIRGYSVTNLCKYAMSNDEENSIVELGVQIIIQYDDSACTVNYAYVRATSVLSGLKASETTCTPRNVHVHSIRHRGAERARPAIGDPIQGRREPTQRFEGAPRGTKNELRSDPFCQRLNGDAHESTRHRRGLSERIKCTRRAHLRNCAHAKVGWRLDLTASWSCTQYAAHRVGTLAAPSFLVIASAPSGRVH
ncbi:hypothetical protein B0H19DRAFT_1084456 [Mycena capillaripes]|nr:hypothetical protein B0H19DRAFT_1084456 [Mycena capillaripes]